MILAFIISSVINFVEILCGEVPFGISHIWKANMKRKEWLESETLNLIGALKAAGWANELKKLHTYKVLKNADECDIFWECQRGFTLWKPHKSNIYTCSCRKEQREHQPQIFMSLKMIFFLPNLCSQRINIKKMELWESEHKEFKKTKPMP